MDDFEGPCQTEDCESLQLLEILHLTTCDVYIKYINNKPYLLIHLFNYSFLVHYSQDHEFHGQIDFDSELVSLLKT